MNTNDRRVLKTQKALRSALLLLLNEKDLHSITVKELVNTADVHRATFYLHYQDVYDLYSQMEKELLEDLTQLISADGNHSSDSIYLAIVDFVCGNKDLVDLAFGQGGNIQLRNKICDLLIQNYLEIWVTEDDLNEITEQMRFVTAYHIQGCLGIIEKWVKNNFQIPKEMIVELIKKADINIGSLY